MSGWKSLDSSKERLGATRRVIRQLIRKCREIQFGFHSTGGENPLDLRREVERSIIEVRVIQRLHTEAVSHEQEVARKRIPGSEGEHASQVARRRRSITRENAKYRLGVALCSISLTVGLELRLQYWMVVDLTVVNDMKPAVIGGHWLRPMRDVDDAESPVPKSNRTIDKGASAVRAPMREYIAHPLQHAHIQPATRGRRYGYAADAAHVGAPAQRVIVTCSAAPSHSMNQPAPTRRA